MSVRQSFGRLARRHALAALALASVDPLAACREPTAPLPAGAVRYVPPAIYGRWWALVASCSGLTGDLAAWSWYRVSRDAMRASPDSAAEAYTDVAARRIVMVAGLESNGGPIRHEMLHALLGPAYATSGATHAHPPAYFQGRCRGVVYCPDAGCADAGAPPAAAPADAPTLPLAALDVGIDAMPAVASRTGATWADRALTIVLRATNPSPRAVWVPLDATPGVIASRVAWRGFRIVPATQPLPITDLTRVDSTGIVAIDTVWRIPFAPGETQRVVFDMSGAAYPPGDYRVVGIFNTRQVAVPLTVSP